MKATLPIFLLPIILLINCTSGKTPTFENKIPLSKEFLIHEWTLDSAYGSSEFIQDRVYFTPDNKFWRCSRYGESQLIDSSFTYKDNKVFHNNKLQYTIFSLDSNNIILLAHDKKVFHCRRRNEYDPEDIERYIRTNPTKKLLNGTWMLDSSEITPAGLPSFCYKLFPGTKFAFKPDGEFEILPKDSSKACNSYSYHIWGNQISIIEYDMEMGLGIVSLTKDKLVLRSKYEPSNTFRSAEIRQHGYKLYFTRE